VRISKVSRAESQSYKKRRTDTPIPSGPGAVFPDIERIVACIEASEMSLQALSSGPGTPLRPRYFTGGGKAIATSISSFRVGVSAMLPWGSVSVGTAVMQPGFM
jgi:hypothetical protein